MMFENFCTCERVSTSPDPAFMFDFYFFELSIKPDLMQYHSTLKLSFDDEGVRERPFASGFLNPCKYGYG